MSKRFYKDVTLDQRGDDFAVLLDGRAVYTPARKLLLLPTSALAEAVADEWRAQGDEIDAGSMRLTGLANAAIDRIETDRGEFERDLANYGDTDLLYYRAGDPEELVARQAASWDPVLDWARGRFDIEFCLVEGVMHADQPSATLQRLRAALAARDDLTLAAFARTVPLSGSLVLMLAVDEGAMDADAAWAASIVDELWEEHLWGEDSLATAAHAARKADYDAAWHFRMLSRRES